MRRAQKVYKAYLTDNDAAPVLLKYRFPKKYRHQALSTQLTRTRITSEARSLARCARGGVRVPQVMIVDVDSGIIGIEWIDGESVRSVLGADEDEEMVENSCAGGGGRGRGESKSSDVAENGIYGISQGGCISISLSLHCHCHCLIHSDCCSATDTLMQLIGRELGRMHRADIIHGDLTTSNMLVRRTTMSTTSTTSTTSTVTTSNVGADAEIVSGHPRPSLGKRATNTNARVGSFDRSFDFDRSSLTLGSPFNRPWLRIKLWTSMCSSGRLHRPIQRRSRSMPR